MTLRNDVPGHCGRMHNERYECAKVKLNGEFNAYAQALLEWISLLNVKCRPITKIRSHRKPRVAMDFMTYAARCRCSAKLTDELSRLLNRIWAKF